MALQLNNGNMSMIQNPVFAAYAKSYQNIYDDFQANVKAFGLPLRRTGNRKDRYSRRSCTPSCKRRRAR